MIEQNYFVDSLMTFPVWMLDSPQRTETIGDDYRFLDVIG